MSFEYPLSFSQQMIWNLQKGEPTKHFYNEGFAFKITGLLDIPILKIAVNKVLEKHSIFKSAFIVRDGMPLQQVQSDLEFELKVEDLTNVNNSDKDTIIKEKVYQETIIPFNFEKAPLCRAKLYILDSNKFLFQFVIHHMICDGFALGEISRELSNIYNCLITNSECSDEPIKVDYSDYVNWQYEWEKTETYSNQLEYWKENLQGVPMSNLPLDYKRPKVNGYTGKRYSFRISEKMTDELKELAKTYGVTLPVMLLTIFQILIHRYGGQSDFGVGVPVLNRSKREFRGIIGIFVNMIVFRCGIESDFTFEEHLKRVWEKLTKDYLSDTFPFHRLVSALPNQRNSNYNPFYDVQFVYRDFGLPEVQFNSTESERVSMYSNTSKVDINFIVDQRPKELCCDFEYNDSLFYAETIERMVESFFTIIEGVIRNPKEKIGLLPIIKKEEIQKNHTNWNCTNEKYESKCIHELIEEQVERTPNKIAIYFEEEEITYRELNERANALARFIYNKNLNKDIPIAVCLNRSPEMIISLIAILKSGHPYIALDPNYPEERIKLMLDDAVTSLIVTENEYKSKFESRLNQCIFIDEEKEVIKNEDVSNLNLKIDLEDLFYIIYTSGSTGKPKGVPIRQKSLSNLLHTMKKRPGITENDTVLAMASISFDMSVPEIYLPLITGSKIALINRNESDMGADLIRILNKYGVTFMCATPTMYRILIETGWEGKEDLKVLCGGEALSSDLINELSKRVDSIWNGYGPSEAIFSSFYEIASNHNYDNLSCAPLGFPISNTKYYVVDRNLQIVPIGVAGELLIAGDCLSPGYLNLEEVTKQKFIDNPWKESNDSILYRTGDLVRRLADGNIEFLGRIDHQVKIRGFRIELEEIEAVLNENEEVLQSVVVSKTYNVGDHRLVAYVVPSDINNTDFIYTLKSYLNLRLPGYMVPSEFFIIEKMPLTPSGKINRKALPEVSISQELKKEYTGPKTELEKIICDVWCELLHVSEIDINDSFFDIGGDSLVVVFVANKLSEVLGQKISVPTIFEYPTLKSLATYISKMKQDEE